MTASPAQTSYICSESEYKNSPKGIARINELTKVAGLGGYKINEAEFSFEALKNYYIKNTAIVSNYVVNCYERLFEYKVADIIKSQSYFRDTSISSEGFFGDIAKSFTNISKGVGEVLDYIILLAVIIAVSIGLYFLTNLFK